MQLELRPIIGASLDDGLSEARYNSQSEVTEYAPDLAAGLWTEQEKSKTLMNVRKLDFVKNLAKPVAITPPEPLKQYFEDTEPAMPDEGKG